MSNGGGADFAIELPKDVAEQVAQATAAFGEISVTLREDGQPRIRDARFEPITISMVWTVFQLASEPAIAVALGIVSNFIYDAMKKRAEKDKRSPQFFTVRFADGTVVEVPLDKPMDANRIEHVLRGLRTKK